PDDASVSKRGLHEAAAHVGAVAGTQFVGGIVARVVLLVDLEAAAAGKLEHGAGCHIGEAHAADADIFAKLAKAEGSHAKLTAEGLDLFGGHGRPLALIRELLTGLLVCVQLAGVPVALEA